MTWFLCAPSGPKSVQYRGKLLTGNPSGQEPNVSSASDSDWLEFKAQLDRSVHAAEQHLEVPAGTIASIPNDVDFIATLKTYAVVESILNDLIGQRPPFLGMPAPDQEYKYRSFVAALSMEGRAGKLTLAEGLSLIAPNDIDFVRAVTQVRNRYAHNARNMHRSLGEILAEVQRNHGTIMQNLTGQNLPKSTLLLANMLKILMYFRLAIYLANALHTLRPPPSPPSGLLGLLTPVPASASVINDSH
jgi:hypothetical protein